jgi:ubiquinone/menaquinone biosynthesis C-methylase UbiE
LAARHCVDKDVVEVACGAGVGLGMLASVSHRTVGGDIDGQNCLIARESYAGRADVEVVELDALQLPFPDWSFDVVVLYEALYYLPSFDEFLSEARRVLRPGGTLLISSVNCRWSEFNPSPFSTRYYDATQLATALACYGFDVTLYGGFPQSASGTISTLTGAVRKAAVRLRLIPKTQKSKEWLKRLFYGELSPIPRVLQLGDARPAELVRINPPFDSDRYRFLYAVAVRQELENA